jgi:hypothetical protein
MLAVKKDGTSRDHYPTARSNTTFRYDRERCAGSGYRLERWKPRQQFRHYSGDVWEIVEDRGGQHGDYFLRCLSGREKGREMVAHGEYMHRDGWTPLPRDLMADLEESLKAVDRGR